MRVHAVTTTRSLMVGVALWGFDALANPPVVRPDVSAEAVVAPTSAPCSTDAVELVGTAIRNWRLVNHTPVSLETLGYNTLWYERLGLDGNWRRRHESYCGFSYFPDRSPIAPGASRWVGHAAVISDRYFAAGTWRAVVEYRDPRHPAFPSRAVGVFEVVGLTPAQAEQVLAVVNDPVHRACVGMRRLAPTFAFLAPPAMLPRLLELSALTVDEREEALVAITRSLYDPTVLQRAIVDPEPSVRSSALRAFASGIAQDEETRTLVRYELVPRVREEGPIDAAHVPALFGVDWDDELWPRVLERLGDPRAPEVGAALATMFESHVARYARSDLVRIRRVLQRTVGRVRGAAVRAAYVSAIREFTRTLYPPANPFGGMTESGSSEENYMVSEACLPVMEALRTLDQFLPPDRMRFVPVAEARPTTTPCAR